MTQSLSPILTPPCHDLEQRAAQFDDILTRHAADEHGIVMASIRLDPLGPLDAGDIGHGQSLITSATAEELYAYEDAGMATGAYLAAQSLRYQVTGEAEALDRADAAYAGLRRIYTLGARGAQPGYFPKPYGGRCSDQISRDQYLFTMSGLAEHDAIAGTERRAEIREMLRAMARYWMRIDYSPAYFGLPPASHLDDYMGSLFLGLIGIAAELTDDAELRREYDRLFTDRRLGPRMPETLTEHFRRGRLYDGAMYYRQPENPMMMKAMAVDFLWDRQPQHRDLWMRSLQAYWEGDLLVPLDLTTGLNYFILEYDAQTGAARRAEPGVVDAIENPLNLAILNWGGDRQHAGSVQVAFAAAIIASRLRSPAAGHVVNFILSKLTLGRFRGLSVSDPRHIPPGHEFEVNLLNSGYLAYWLWTYWLARNRGML